MGSFTKRYGWMENMKVGRLRKLKEEEIRKANENISKICKGIKGGGR